MRELWVGLMATIPSEPAGFGVGFGFISVVIGGDIAIC